MKKIFTLTLLIINIVTLGAFPLSAKTVDERLTELEEEVRVLKRLKEVEQDIDQRKDTDTPALTAGEEGFILKSKDGSFQLKLKGQVQGDSRYFAGDDTQTGTSTFLLRRVRPTLEGTVFKYFDFRIMPDFGGGTTTLQDAYINFKYWKQASLRGGKFKSPVSLERLQSDPNSLFVENSLVSNLVPNRDVGVDLNGEFWKGALSYDLALLNGVVDNGSADIDIHDDKDFAGRIFVLPFKNTEHDAVKKLGVGIGGSFGTAHGSTSSSQLPSYRSGGQQTFFSFASGVFADGIRSRIVPQAYYYYGPFGLLGEFAFSSQEVKRGVDAGTIKNSAWEIQTSYVITGEDASYSGVAPRNNFDPRNGTWGAFEVAGRFGWLNADPSAFPLFASSLTSAQEAIAWTIGLNWYLNKNLKFATDFEETFFHSGGPAGGNREPENVILSRLQVAF